MKKAVLLLCILALGVLFILSGCKAPEEPEAPEVTPEVPEELPGEEVMAPEEIIEGAWLASVSCDGEKVAATIVNQGSEDYEIFKDIKILLRGLVVTKFDCDKMTLAPGEGAICADISGGFPLADENEIMLRAPGGVQEVESVTCAPPSAEEAE